MYGKIGADKSSGAKGILVSCSLAELTGRIATLAAVKKDRNCQSNQEEFCVEKNEASGCSRVDVKRIPRKLQIKTLRVENLHGPLDRLQKHTPPSSRSGPILLTEGVEERVHGMEQHLGLGEGRTGPASLPRDIYDRLKDCEERLLELEKVAPCRDFLHFVRLKKKLKEQGITDRDEVDDAYVALMAEKGKERLETGKKRKREDERKQKQEQDRPETKAQRKRTDGAKRQIVSKVKDDGEEDVELLAG